jgi:hypothetical protein
MTPKESAELELSQALRMVLLAYRDLEFDDFHILGKCNLVLQGFIGEDGDFTEEYIELAKRAIDDRQKQDLTPKIITSFT